MPHVRHVHWDEARRLFARAIAGGAARLSTTTVHWDVSQGCERPYTRITMARPARKGNRDKFVVIGPGTRGVLEVRMELPCSACPRCRRRIATSWRHRAALELAYATRTWFGTLTFRPSERYKLLASASAAYGPGFAGLPERQRFRLIEREGYKEAQRYWKRVRANSGARLKYLMVAEQHQDGSLHYHVLVHEKGTPIRHAQLSAAWWCGFTRWKLVDPMTGNRSAGYVTKYLTKALSTRSRASQGYGEFSLKESGRNDAERNYDSKGEPDPSKQNLVLETGRHNGEMEDGTTLSSRNWTIGFQVQGSALPAGTAGGDAELQAVRSCARRMARTETG